MIRNPSLVKRKQFSYDFCYKGEEEFSFCHLWVVVGKTIIVQMILGKFWTNHNLLLVMVVLKWFIN
jgi:hypothetical protein